jgi:hypothetical protein
MGASMTARDTYNASCKSAEGTRTASLLTNELTRQTSCDAQLSVVGLVLQNGNSAYVTAVANANRAKVANDFATEQARQATRDAAREVLRSTGDVGPT